MSLCIVFASHCFAEVRVSSEMELSPSLAGGEAGQAVACGFDWIAVGAPFTDVDTKTNQGVVYVYNRLPDGNWNLTNMLTAASGTAHDRFGQSLAACSNRLAIGASGDDQGGDEAGAVHIFETDGTNWAQAAKLRASAPTAGDVFGCSVALDGDRLAIGARRRTASGKTNAGSVYIFERDAGGTWSQKWIAEASDPMNFDYFGCSVALDGDLFVAGADNSDYNGSKIRFRLCFPA